jgi:S1-C subfamily serine protease
MTIKKHHKIILGGTSTVIIIALIFFGIILNGLVVKQQINQDQLIEKIETLEKKVNGQITELAVDIFNTKYNLEENFQNVNEEINYLKADNEEDFSGIVEQSIESVLTIRTLYGQGTGFLITNSGYFVTNVHVISDNNGEVPNLIQAITKDKTIHQVKLIGGISKLDLALLKIDGEFKSLELADSENIELGEQVIAIGNPEGLQFSVTEGIISAIKRIGFNNLPYYIQTSAALNPGNSGGPLINKEGKVIGMNNFKLVESEGIGFALESNQIKIGINAITQELMNQTII